METVQYHRNWACCFIISGCFVMLLIYSNLQDPLVIPDFSVKITGLAGAVSREGSTESYEDLIARRFEDRRRHAQWACHQASLPTVRTCHRETAVTHLFPIGSHNMTYCAIEKAGSTYWKRIIRVITSSSSKPERKAVSPFDVSKSVAYGLHKKVRNNTFGEVTENMKFSRNIIFVRDPFSRVFSGYLDKLFNVNVYYWSVLGKFITKQERPHPSNTSLACGNDVTFSELISFLAKKVKRGQCVDPHFIPSYGHCLPCNFTYTYIGKYETMQEDVAHILSTEGLQEKINITNVEESNDIDSIVDGSKFAFTARKQIQKCMPFVDGLHRFWRRLQARGMLDKRSKFPLTEADEHNITEPQFRDKVIEAYREYDRKDRVLNRQEALSEAYASLNGSLAKQFREAFHLDFEIFGYPNDPPVMNTAYKYLLL